MREDIAQQFRDIRKEVYSQVSSMVIEEFPYLEGTLRLTEIGIDAVLKYLYKPDHGLKLPYAFNDTGCPC